MSLMQVKCFHQGTPFIRCCNNPCFPAPGRNYSQRPHMFLDDVPFPVREVVFPGCIPQSRSRMEEPMQLMRILCILHVPVIQEIVMEQCSSDQLSAVATDMQLFADGQTIPCHIHHMAVYCHISMLYKSFRSMKISGS